MTDTLDALSTDEELAAAAAVVLERADAGDGTVTWADVAGDVPAKQWGRLLAADVLVATDGGFVVGDPDAVRGAVADSGVAVTNPDGTVTATEQATHDESDATDWSAADKLAGVGAAGLMASYQLPGPRSAVGSTVHEVLGPVQATLPFGLTIVLLALATTVLSTTIRSRLTDGSGREQLQERLETVQEQLERARERGDDAAVDRLESRQRDLMVEQLGMLKGMLRPMVWTMLVTIPVFLWLTWLTVNPAAAITPAAQLFPIVGRVVWTARLVGPMRTWMVWYFVCSILSNVVGKRAIQRVKPLMTARTPV